ncbi:MAG: hypothetical protein PHY92_03805 [Alphaproteobacteria bacterium]|nr:hypothetical protein [Alphaproteobacteria bacterium]
MPQEIVALFQKYGLNNDNIDLLVDLFAPEAAGNAQTKMIASCHLLLEKRDIENLQDGMEKLCSTHDYIFELLTEEEYSLELSNPPDAPPPDAVPLLAFLAVENNLLIKLNEDGLQEISRLQSFIQNGKDDLISSQFDFSGGRESEGAIEWSNGIRAVSFPFLQDNAHIEERFLGSAETEGLALPSEPLSDSRWKKGEAFFARRVWKDSLHYC